MSILYDIHFIRQNIHFIRQNEVNKRGPRASSTVACILPHIKRPGPCIAYEVI